MHKLITAVTVAVLSLAAATAVQAQRPPESIVTTSPQGRALRAVQYHANCLKGTLASHKLEVANPQGSLTQEVPLEREDKIATVPAKGTVAAEILRYACFQF
ncbi:MAG: hypothetical protein EAZ18_00305 [Oscillatoriales cyanobacterium]|nr:MAG: hypothetical protein EAZ18_00305 [Oscillatoriales cyanobacterium]